MDDVEPLNTWRVIISVALAAAVGCIIYSTLEAGSMLLSQVVASLIFGFEWKSRFWEMVVIYTLFGMPIAVVAGLVIGLPVWVYADAQRFRSKVNALKFGASVGAVIGIVFLGYGLIMGLQTYLDDTASFNSWKFGNQVIQDGLPTAIGWIYKLQTLFFFIVAGGLAGLTARRIAVPR